MEVVITAVLDEWPRTRRYKTAVVVTICGLSFVAGLPLCWSGGLYYLMMLNDYTINFPLFVVAMVNVFVFVVCFGEQSLHTFYILLA
jgi:SNF family Na+-dependent transporter